MPWCEECDHLLEDEQLDEDGACPTCGTVLVDQVRPPVPWYFRAMLVLTVLYLLFRTYQGVDWLIHHV